MAAASLETAAHDAAIDALVSGVSACPPVLSPHDASVRCADLPPAAQQLLVFRLSSLLQTVVYEVEAERERLLDAQSALYEVMQRVVSQDAAREQQASALLASQRALATLTHAHAKLQSRHLRCRHGRDGRAQPRGAEEAVVGADASSWVTSVDSAGDLWLVSDGTSAPVPQFKVEGSAKLRAARVAGAAVRDGPSPPTARPAVGVRPASAQPVRQRGFAAGACGHGVFGPRGTHHSLERQTRARRA